MDFDVFGVDDGGKVNKVYLDTQFRVPNEEIFTEREEESEALHHLVTSENK